VSAQPVFYYDLGSPECYLAAESAAAILPVMPEWEPVLAVALIGSEPAREPIGGAVDHRGIGGAVDRQAIERIAAQQGLQPLRWPARWPPETRRAMLAATYAKRIGRAVAFSLAAFRQAFAGGRDLGDPDTVLLAAAACEMHPAAVLKGIGLRSVAEALDGATERARAAGVQSLPAIKIGDRVFGGLEAAAREMQNAAGATR
jgi:2-hydroxychromene-2-carboxylate isomerase